MKLLLDSHAAVWFAEDDPRLSAAAGSAIEDADNLILLSAVVCWEVAIKRGLGKWNVAANFDTLLLEGGAVPLPVSLQHARGVENLPQHHGDPFDRLLISQARIERATIVSRDPRFTRYDVPVLW